MEINSTEEKTFNLLPLAGKQPFLENKKYYSLDLKEEIFNDITNRMTVETLKREIQYLDDHNTSIKESLSDIFFETYKNALILKLIYLETFINNYQNLSQSNGVIPSILRSHMAHLVDKRTVTSHDIDKKKRNNKL